MSTSFEIKSSFGSYPVSVCTGILEDALKQHRRDVLMVDEWFVPVFASGGYRMIALKASESAKSLDAMPEVIGELRKLGASRENRLLAIGGGVIQDVTCFVASIYMRGVRWSYVPTTLLAMTDSCIGGKSSINVGPYKNLIGTFHPPAAILVDPSLVSSLSGEQRVSGLIEACKICYCRGSEAFRKYLDLRPGTSMATGDIEELLCLSLLSKKWFIEIDEFDRAERLLLNFGHTFGHALEGASHFRIAHGVAVGIGILCALRLGEHLGRTYRPESPAHALETHTRCLLAELPSLSEGLAAISISDLLDRFAADKKHSSTKYSVVVVAETGEVELLRVPKDPSFIELIAIAVKEVIGSYSVNLSRA